MYGHGGVVVYFGLESEPQRVTFFRCVLSFSVPMCFTIEISKSCVTPPEMGGLTVDFFSSSEKKLYTKCKIPGIIVASTVTMIMHIHNQRGMPPFFVER